MYFFYYIPVGINSEIRKFPFITVFYSFLCVAIFAGNRYLSSHLPLDFYNLIYIPGNSTMLSAITAAFLHFGYIHLVGNLVYLLLFGRYVEDRMGPVFFTALFLSSAWISNYLQGIYNAHVLHQGVVGIIGASGAISGMLGAFAVRFLMSRLRIAYWLFFPLQAYTKAGFVEVPAILALVLWFVMQAMQGLVQLGAGAGNVAYVTHISGFVWGIAVALAWGGLEKGRIEAAWRRAQGAIKRGDYLTAQEGLLKFLGAKPEDGEAHASLARVLLVTGSEGRAEKSYRAACELLLEGMRRGDAEEVYREALRGFNDLSLTPEPQLDLAFGLERNLKPELALKAYANFAARYPMHSEAPFALLRAANLHWNTFLKHEKARKCYQLLIEKYPEDTWVDFAREQMRLLKVHHVA